MGTLEQSPGSDVDVVVLAAVVLVALVLVVVVSTAIPMLPMPTVSMPATRRRAGYVRVRILPRYHAIGGVAMCTLPSLLEIARRDAAARVALRCAVESIAAL